MIRAYKLLMKFLSLAVVLGLVFGSGILFAAEKKEAAKPKKKAKSVSALKAGVDPAEKIVREVSKQDDKVLSERLQQALKQYPRQQAQTRSDGTKSLVVAPQFLNFSVATAGSDGKINHTCTKGEKKHADQKQTLSNSEPEE